MERKAWHICLLRGSIDMTRWEKRNVEIPCCGLSGLDSRAVGRITEAKWPLMGHRSIWNVSLWCP